MTASRLTHPRLNRQPQSLHLPEPFPSPPSHLHVHANECVVRPGAPASAPVVRTFLCVQDLLRMRPPLL
eukprot:6359483-Prymnesium_polylepis.1